MFAVVVTFEVKPDSIDDFMPLMLANAEKSLADEAHCHQFDVCTDPQRPNEVFLYELYSDRAGFEVHLGSAHFEAFDITVTDMIASKDVRTYEKVAS